MRKFITLLLLFSLFTIPIQGCQSSESETTSAETNNDNQEIKQTIAVPSITPRSTTLSTPVEYTHNIFVESQAGEFQMKEVEESSGFLIEEVSNSTGEYRAFEACDPHCFVYIEEESSGKIYKLISTFLQGDRGYSDLVWTDEVTLEFTLVSQPHHGVRFTINVETKEIIGAFPVPLD